MRRRSTETICILLEENSHYSIGAPKSSKMLVKYIHNFWLSSFLRYARIRHSFSDVFYWNYVNSKMDKIQMKGMKYFARRVRLSFFPCKLWGIIMLLCFPLFHRILFLEVFVNTISLRRSFVVNDIVGPKVALNYACARWRSFFIICGIFQTTQKHRLKFFKNGEGKSITDGHLKKRMSTNWWEEKNGWAKTDEQKNSRWVKQWWAHFSHQMGTVSHRWATPTTVIFCFSGLAL